MGTWLFHQAEPALPSRSARVLWPGLLADRVLAVAVAVYRSRAANVVGAVGLTGFAALAGPRAATPASHPQIVAFDLVVLLSTFLGTLSLAVARRPAAESLAVVLVVDAALWLLGHSSWAMMVASLLALSACPLLLSRAASVAVLALAEVLVIGAAFGSLSGNRAPLNDTVATGLAVVLAWGAGETVRARRRSAALEAAAARQVEALRQLGVIARERSGIARELHDVVAHHVSMIAVRAATAPYAVADVSDPARIAFAEIAHEARIALDQLRTVLGVLRSPDVCGEQGPQPRLTDLPGMLDRMRGTGMDVSFVAAGPARTLPEPVGLCAYRIVQEALTNSARHAPGSRVSVEVRYAADVLALMVCDDGSGRRPAAAGAPVPGFGLIGLQERVAMLGGKFEAGPGPAGGFRVTARLPVPVLIGVPPPADDR